MSQPINLDDPYVQEVIATREAYRFWGGVDIGGM